MKASGRPSWWLVGLLLLLTMATSSCVTVGVQWARQFDKPRPEIIRDLDRTSGAFTARLQQRIPLGAPEGALISKLAAQGFTASWPTGSDERGAEVNWVMPGCGMRASVFWRVDGGRRITSLRGRIHDTGCL